MSLGVVSAYRPDTAQARETDELMEYAKRHRVNVLCRVIDIDPRIVEYLESRCLAHAFDPTHWPSRLRDTRPLRIDARGHIGPRLDNDFDYVLGADGELVWCDMFNGFYTVEWCTDGAKADMKRRVSRATALPGLLHQATQLLPPLVSIVAEYAAPSHALGAPDPDAMACVRLRHT